MPGVLQDLPLVLDLRGDAGITDGEYEIFRRLIHARTGISLGPHKRHLVQARLGRRLRALGLRTFTEYHQYLRDEDPGGAEILELINAITTNKTDFFREAHHFAYLQDVWLPEMRAQAARTGARALRIWSAGCSSGEEPYTIAVTLREALGGAGGWDVKILASDIDTSILDRATQGIYTAEQAAPVPPALRARHFLRGVGARAGHVQVRPEVRALVAFRRINLLDDPWPIRTTFDAIFCRNVLIYFDRPTQQRLLERLVGVLKGGGLLFLGHSESIHGLLTGLSPCGTTIYQVPAAAGATIRDQAAGGRRPMTGQERQEEHADAAHHPDR